MKIVALCKTWDGAEWINICLRSIYPHVDAIVLVHSERSWLGEQGNTCRAEVEAHQAEYDHDNKIYHVGCNTTSQEEQYAEGLRYIKSARLPCDLVMVVDVDEIWTPQDLARAKEVIAKDQIRSPGYRCPMQTYLKTPFYQVDPPFSEALCFLRYPDGAQRLTTHARGRGCPSKLLSNCWMHHFTYVRKTAEDVFRKILQSSTADGDRRTQNWKEEVWDRLPFAKNLHGCDQWRHVWKGVKRVFRHQIPTTVWESPLMQTFIDRTDTLLESEMDVLYTLSQGLNHVVELGTLRGVGATILSLGANRVDTIDLFENVPSDAVIHTIEGETTTFAAKDFIAPQAKTEKNLSWYSNVNIVQEDAIIAAHRYAPDSLDLVFVDADHSFECTYGCASAWWSRLKPDGIMLFHDYCEGNPGVIKAFDQFRTEVNLPQMELPTKWPGSLVALKKGATDATL